MLDVVDSVPLIDLMLLALEQCTVTNCIILGGVNTH